MPELKKFKKLYRPLTPEQRQKCVDSAIRKRIESFDRMDQRHFRKLTKAAKESKELELKKLRRRLKVALKSETASEAEKEQDPELLCVAAYERADMEQWRQEIDVGQRCKPEAIVTLAFRRLHKELSKIAEKEKIRKAKEKEAAKKAEEEAEQKAAEAEKEDKLGEAALKRERPDDSADLPKPKKSKKNKKAKDEEAPAAEVPAQPEVEAEIKQEPEVKQEAAPKILDFDPKKVEAPDGAKYGQQMGMSKWGQQKIDQGLTLLPAVEDNSVMNGFVERVMKHPVFNDQYLVVKKIQLQQKGKFEVFKKQCVKHQLLAEQKALENGLNPPPKKGKKGQQQKKKRKFVKMTEEERLAAKKFKYNKNKERNKQRKIEKDQRKAEREQRLAQKNANDAQA